MSTFKLFTWMTLCLAVLQGFNAHGGETAFAHHFSNPGRTVAIADVHGDFEAMTTILRQAGLIGEDRDWTGGGDHLVVAGDVLDRGPESRRAMDLLMALEPQAVEAGGGVHLILGNHEVMNLVGDLRYVSAAEYAAFASEESAEMRQQGWTAHLQFYGAPDDEAAARAAFDEKYPPGYFAHRAAFRADGQYGRWLLEKPVIVTVNETAFTHGGLSESSAEFTFDDLNRIAHEQLIAYLLEYQGLVRAGVLPPTSEFYERAAILDAYAAGVAAGSRNWSAELAASAAQLKELEGAFIHSPQGPAWYRGNVGCSVLIEADRLLGALRSQGVARLVVGHTPTPGRRVQSRFDGALLEIDTGMLSAYYRGRASALILDQGEASVIYQSEPGAATPMVQSRRVGVRPAGMSADELAAILASGDIASRSQDDAGNVRLRLAAGDSAIEAAVMPRAGRSFYPEVAAYRLDRLLGLDMVPVTVLREVDGDTREVQFQPSLTINEAQRARRGLGGGANCPLGDQFEALYLFDTLILSAPRQPQHILYSTDTMQLILTGHEQAFGTARRRPAHLSKVQVDLSAGWRRHLEALDEASLRRALDGVLSKRRIEALLKRRDLLLEG